MVLESNGYSVRVTLMVLESSAREHSCTASTCSWCWKVTVMVLERNGYGVREAPAQPLRAPMVLESNGYGVGEKRLWC
jgi:hypothetical protein